MNKIWLAFEWPEMLLVPVIICMILGLMYGVRCLATHFELSSEMQRKMIHVAVGIASLFFPFIFSNYLPVFVLIACAILLMLFMRLSRSRESGLGTVIHSVSRPSYGEIYLSLAIAILFFRSQENPVLYVLPLMVITLSDTASALIGKAYGRVRFAVKEGIKSLEGSIAFFMVTLICSMVVLLLMSDTPRVNVIVLSFLIAAFCTLVEADSWHGLDNLFVPIGAHLLLERYIGADPWTLIIVALIFITMIVLTMRLTGLLDITKHEARSRTILIFLILTVTQPINATLPFIAIIAHTLVSKWKSCTAEAPVLNLIAVIAGVAIFWLLVGELIGKTAINLFNITFASAAAIFLSLAIISKKNQIFWRFAIVPITILIGVICWFIVHMNPVNPLWYDPMWPFILFSIFLSVFFSWLMPTWFNNWRCTKTFGIALIIPLSLLISKGVF